MTLTKELEMAVLSAPQISAWRLKLLSALTNTNNLPACPDTNEIFIRNLSVHIIHWDYYGKKKQNYIARECCLNMAELTDSEPNKKEIALYCQELSKTIRYFRLYISKEVGKQRTHVSESDIRKVLLPIDQES